MTPFKTLAIAAAAVAVLATPASAKPMRPSGTITIDETQFGFLIGGNTGGGTLRFHGKSYPFKIGGISIGDLGVSKVRGYGEVYNLKSIDDFAGTFSKLDASATLGKGEGGLRLKNGAGVELELHTRSKGLQLSAGAGGVKVTLR